ncbi:MAG TPA: T9SS type A sorting domain-containing protein, partial [Bacteroidia bacterium]|nr:T9SS type A sorting domain-containing protein [Bacteroidia bacterium]
SQTSISTSVTSFIAIDSGMVAIANPVVTTICSNVGVDDYIFDSNVLQLNQSESAIDFILSDKTDEIKSIDVYSVLGSKVRISIETNQTISTNGLSKGVYFYRVITNNKIPYTGKFIVK